MPFKRLTNKQFKRKYKPWITEGIIQSIQRKNKLFNKYMKCKEPNLKNNYHSEYKVLKNRITALLRESKEGFYRNYFSKNTKNLKNIWKGIKEVINIKSKQLNQPTSLQVDDINITDPTDIANKFNDYFSSIADEIISKRKYEGKKLFSDYLNNPNNSSFYMYPTDGKEVLTNITLLNDRKACGPVSIPTEPLKLIKEDICIPLSNIFNLSFTNGVHPEKLRIAQVYTYI